MPKRASLQPIKCGPETSPWMVNIPVRMSPTGKRQRFFFAAKGQAKTFADRQRIRVDNYGVKAMSLSPGQLEEAAAAFEEIKPFGVSLREVVLDFIRRHKQRGNSIPLHNLFSAYVAVKKNRSESHLRDLKSTLRRMAALHDKLVCDITHREIDGALAGSTPASRNAHLRNLRAIFNYGIKKEYLIDNPIARLDFAEIERKQIEILAPEQAEKLMKLSDPGLVPYMAIGLFAGVRPHEIRRMEWRDVDLEKGEIVIRSEVAKTRQKRAIAIEANLRAWLAPHKGKDNAPIVSPVNLRSRLRLVRKSAGFATWHQDIMRHSYASYWLARPGADHKTLMLALGHTTTAMLFEHYYGHASAPVAAKYWKIMPQAKSRRKIVPFAA